MGYGYGNEPQKLGNWNLHSATFCPTGVMGMLYGISHHMGGNFNWHGTTDAQRQVADMFTHAAPVLEAKGVAGLKTFASFHYERLNAVLREHGYSIQINPFAPPDVGAVAIFGADVEWQQPGMPRTLFTRPGSRSASGGVPGAYLERGVRLFLSGDTPQIAEISTRSDDQVFLLPYYESTQLGGISLLSHAIRSLQARKAMREEYGSLRFPMANIRHKPDVSWLVGMEHWTLEGSFHSRLQQALQENSLELDHLGARVRSATAGSASRGGPRYMLDIEGPYLFCLVRNGMLDFVALCAPDSWRDPSEGKPLMIQDVSTAAPIESVDTPVPDINEPMPPNVIAGSEELVPDRPQDLASEIGFGEDGSWDDDHEESASVSNPTSFMIFVD